MMEPNAALEATAAVPAEETVSTALTLAHAVVATFAICQPTQDQDGRYGFDYLEGGRAGRLTEPFANRPRSCARRAIRRCIGGPSVY